MDGSDHVQSSTPTSGERARCSPALRQFIDGLRNQRKWILGEFHTLLSHDLDSDSESPSEAWTSHLRFRPKTLRQRPSKEGENRHPWDSMTTGKLLRRTALEIGNTCREGRGRADENMPYHQSTLLRTVVSPIRAVNFMWRLELQRLRAPVESCCQLSIDFGLGALVVPVDERSEFGLAVTS